MADLSLILNVSEQIPALRRVRALDQLLMLDLPPLVVGTTLSGDLRLCDGAGALVEGSGEEDAGLRLVISRIGAAGPEILVEVENFEPLEGEDPEGWSFELPLTSDALVDYLGTAGESKEAVFDLTMSAGATLLYRRAVTLLPPVPESTP